MAQCIYSNFDGECELWEDGIDQYSQFCYYEDNPYPGDCCEGFEDSNRICSRCGGNSVGDCDQCNEDDWE